MTHFFAMGGYAGFVWPAYGVSFVGLAAAVVLTWRGYTNARRALEHAEKAGGP